MRIKRWKKQLVGVDPLDFSPGLLRIQAQPPAPFARTLLYLLLTLLGFLLVWAAIGRLDIVASAEGKLIPQSYLKIVQPSEQGVIRDILVEEGQRVKAGQVLMRMDTTLSGTDVATLNTDAQGKRLALRRIDAEKKAEECFHTALAIAIEQGTKQTELLVVTSLARLCQRRRKRAEGRRWLAPVLAWFTEGFDTLDLREGKAFVAD